MPYGRTSCLETRRERTRHNLAACRSLETLRAQLNAPSPNQSKLSDGTIRDAAHASR